MQKEKEDEEEEERDEWFETIKEDQAKMLLEKSRRQQDSDASESEELDGDESQVQEEEEKQDKKAIEAEVIGLKRRLIEILEANENANEALKRLRGTSKIIQKKKNVRSSAKAEEVSSSAQDTEKFQELLAITTRL